MNVHRARQGLAVIAGGAQQGSAGYTFLEGIQVPMALLVFGPTLALLYHHGLSLLLHGQGLAEVPN